MLSIGDPFIDANGKLDFKTGENGRFLIGEHYWHHEKHVTPVKEREIILIDNDRFIWEIKDGYIEDINGRQRLLDTVCLGDYKLYVKE